MLANASPHDSARRLLAHHPNLCRQTAEDQAAAHPGIPPFPAISSCHNRKWMYAPVHGLLVAEGAGEGEFEGESEPVT
jgi:hypothetical protein